MAESKFLEHQDKNNDKLIDKCGEQPIVPEESGCAPSKCTPDSSALVPDWKTQGNDEPWYNGKECTYEVTITTTETSIMPSADSTEEESRDYVLTLFDDYQSEAVNSLLVNLDKKVTDDALNTVNTYIEHKKYDLDVRPSSRLKLLYAIPHEHFAPLEETSREDEEEDDDSETNPDSSDIVVVIDGLKNLNLKLIRIRKALYLYGRYYKVFRALENANLVFEESGKIFDLDPYGDMTLFGNSTLSRVLPALDSFLNSKQLDIPNSGKIGSGWSKDKIIKLTLTFATGYSRLKKIEAEIEGCVDPIVFKGRLLRSLNSRESFKDPTALAYFAQVEEMHQALTARLPMDWKDYVIQFTFPTIVEKVNYRIEEEDESALTCMADALLEEGKQLGQDILDPSFSLADAISYKFHMNVCKTQASAQEEREEMGLEVSQATRERSYAERARAFGASTINVQDPTDPNQSQGIYAYAQEQAYKQLAANQNSFEMMCMDFIASGTAGSMSIDDIFAKSFDRIKLCGLHALLLDTIQCLMKGTTLEASLAGIVKSALSAMSIDNFGQLFIGLPPQKQQQLNALANAKLASGDFFKDSSQNQQLSDAMAGNYKIIPPWENTNNPNYPVRTIAQQFDLNNLQNMLGEDIVMEAYIQALIEEYSDDLLALVDLLNEFPGAPIIANIIAALDCPVPPLFEPPVMDFIKDLELPFCRNIGDITLPALQNPFGWIPSKMDISAALFEAVTLALQKALIEIMMKIMVKICELFGSFVCNILETTGDLAKALVTGNSNEFADIVKASICGPDASDEDVNDTIEDMLNTLGPGAGAFADQEDAIQFTQDVSSATTRKEMTDAFLGNCSNDFLNIVDSIIEYEYPELRVGLYNKEKICAFFTQSGNLFPADIKNQMRDFSNQLPENDMLPANPSLCADPAQLENFCQMRIQLLEGRATEEQVQQMCENLQEELQDNLEDLGSMLQDTPGYLADNMPPIVSEDPCDDGLIPFEAEEAAKVATITLTDALEKLKLEYIEDMMGNGGVPFTDADWGLLNMILSDTYGNPLTTHNRKAHGTWGPVMDFITNEDIDWKDLTPWTFWMLFLKPMPSIFQKAALPISVAKWMRNYLKLWTTTNSSDLLSTNNDWEDAETYSRTFKELGFKGLFGDDVDLTKIPDQGFNIKYRINFEDERVNIIRAGRKATPDTSLEYKDNCKGRKKPVSLDSTFDHGFKIDMYLSELHKKGGEIANMRSNNVRVNINDIQNLTAPGDLPSIFSLYNPLAAKDNMEELFNALNSALPDKPEEERKYEFFAIDDTFDGIDMTQYPQLLKTFEKKEDYPPQLILLKEIINQQNNTAITSGELESLYNEENKALMLSIQNFFVDDQTNSRDAYLYGAAYDNLSYEEFDYMAPMEYQTPNPDTHKNPASLGALRNDYQEVNGRYLDPDSGLPGLLYADLEIYDPDASFGGITDDYRHVRNSDMILGISRNQYNAATGEHEGNDQKIFEETRVFYLNPVQYGGSYKRAPMAVKPLKNRGWMGFLDAVFPPMTDCPDTDDDLVDFGSIKKRIDDSYSRIPEDQRLKSPQECAVQLPYNRILERASKAGLESIISAAIQIYIGTHFVKCMPMYTFLKPSAPDNYSNMLISYIVEVMEESLKDAQGPFRELFNTFKDNEFWYAFLEQSVQLYGRLVDDGQILDVPVHVQEAVTRLNDMQSVYDYPNRDALIEAIKLGDEPWYQIFNLPGYRGEKNLEAVQATEEDAKLILGELVAREFNATAKRMKDNLESTGHPPSYDKLAYWFLENEVEGAVLDLKGPLTEEASNLAQPPAPYYTDGGELYISQKEDSESEYTEGEDYIGYYHVNTDQSGNTTYMVGKEHTEADHDILAPYEDQIIVKNANGNGFGEILDINHAITGAKAFSIRQYVSVNGSPESTSIILAGETTQNISDVYPGTLQYILDDEGNVVGLEGESGVRHGIVFYYGNNKITSVEIDALDVKIGQFQAAKASGKLLLCLINALIEDEKFKLFTEYIFPLNKFTALYTIYNDLALLPSIGESIFKPEEGLLEMTIPFSSDANPSEPAWKIKPGAYFDTKTYAAYVKDAAAIGVPYKLPDPFNLDGLIGHDGLPHYGGNDGWEEYSVRKPGGLADLFGSTTWDQWDQVLLRNSKNRIKQIFKSYYYSRDFKPGDSLYEERPSKVRKQRLRDLYKPRPGITVLPFWKRRLLRPNPFIVCEKTDDNSDE
jgi:hypothetical protein|tara:strand:+ start:2355 stop:9011 length:6657 start_codon:yes stop_codon:yes gene_type:complete